MNKVLIANRGEIARRIIRACRELDLPTVAVYSHADEEALHVREADQAVSIGEPHARKSYLNIERLIAAARESGADAIHPGYGFLSESLRFAEACEAAGITFVGPPASAIAAMGDKAAARRIAQAHDVPVVPGGDAAADVEASLRAAEEVGYPVLVKAAAGGGGRGISVARSPDELRAAFVAAAREAEAAFGDPTLYIEKLIEPARHVEVQVLGRGGGEVLHLYERECSLQRRRQKLLEESPSPGLHPPTRDAMTAAADRLAAAVGYVGAGTVEFLVDQNERFYFIEMNTRLQVEHGVTEMVTGIDLVRAQLLIAAGEELEFAQDDIRVNGSAIEFRINAEDPAQDFRPSPGRIDVAELPGGFGVRVDTAIYAGYTVVPFYDSLIAKLMVWAPTREQALRRGRRALREFRIEGIATTLPLHMRLVDDQRVRSGEVHTGYLEQLLSEGDAAAGLAAQVSSVNRDGEAK
ncbi:MAG TPA: acetyl-CoA carboxylase biotin carboxylase subunit [Solirubrobacterales bacterium]|nr:acetyl-CoA carboxylase biotin carboxylase subunit [Solirubrobacterales bacterium]